MKLSFEYIKKILELMNELQIFEIKIRVKNLKNADYLLIRKPYFSFEEHCFKLEFYDEKPCYDNKEPIRIFHCEIYNIDDFKKRFDWNFLGNVEILEKIIGF